MLLSLLVGSTLLACSGDDSGRGGEVLDRQSVVIAVDNYSSRIFDAFQLQNYLISSDQKVQRPCAGDGLAYGLNHFWHLEGVLPQQMVPAVSRLRTYLLESGWQVSPFEVNPGAAAAFISASNPDDGYVIWAKGIEDLNRIAVQVSSPCLKIAGRPS